MVLGIERIPNF